MSDKVRRIFVEKKKGYNVEAYELLHDIRENLNINGLKDLRIINRYDVCETSDNEWEDAKKIIFSEPVVDNIYEEQLEVDKGCVAFAVEFLPGQYDQRADSAAQCIKILSQNEKSNVASAKVYILNGDIDKIEIEKIKKYCINPVDSREAAFEKPESIENKIEFPNDVKILNGFIEMDDKKLELFRLAEGLAMSFDDIKFCAEYFRNTEKRNPSYTEIKVIDTYWSDHCRHTTFDTKIENVKFQTGSYNNIVDKVYHEYLDVRKTIYKDDNREICLMDIALIAMKEIKKNGKLQDLDTSDEINACSIETEIKVNGKKEKWLVMFKNETHNHPTEIEPFGGAATCIGGCIRDPLSGRAYVYQAMRVTGSADPRTKIEDTIPGRLPQRKITTRAAHGYSSYGNQIGLATGQVTEIYHEGYAAKRMEIGAVVGAMPKKNIVREKPQAGDIIILLGGRTGRDGCGGATGSSKEHDEKSLTNCGAEVQKGNAPTERKLQRLFRNIQASTLIKKCNDFGAGGVSVAIGELSDGLDINLDLVTKKYEGLDGTELAISESQERIAVVVNKEDADKFIQLALNENLEAKKVAIVTEEPRLKLSWRDKYIVDISRAFLDTNGIRQKVDVFVKEPDESKNFFKNSDNIKDVKGKIIDTFKDLNVCSQKGLVEMFDSTIGANTILSPFGGKYQMTPSEAMSAKLPVLNGDTETATLMAYGYNPNLSSWSPFHGALYAVIESASKIVACGGDYSSIRLTFQEYFERLGKDPERWGKPFSALLGAFYAQRMLEIPAIGGKDSMSGTFKDINVPPTLVSFALNIVNSNVVVSQEFKKIGSHIVVVPLMRDKDELPDFNLLKDGYNKVHQLIEANKVSASYTVKQGGIIEAIGKMAFGNKIGITINANIVENTLFAPDFGSIILEISQSENIKKLFGDTKYFELGFTNDKKDIIYKDVRISIDELIKNWTGTLESIFPTKAVVENKIIKTSAFMGKSKRSAAIKIAKPKVFIPVFPGTNCEYDSERAFIKAGAECQVMVLKNLSSSLIQQSVDLLAKEIDKSQIIMLPGGFSAGDEPDGSGKFIAAVLRNPKVSESIMKLLKERDGLILGICNGFQALIKLGLVPFGEIRDIDESCPTLTYNSIGRHVSTVVNTKILSVKSPWLYGTQIGDIHAIPVSHGEGRFVGKDDVIKSLFENGQITTQYVDFSGKASYDIEYNPNGSMFAIEGITSPDGRVFGKMGHSERIGENVGINIPGNKDQKLFESGVKYFK